MNRTLIEWKILILAERKKAITLAALVGVMVVLGARQLWPGMRPSSAQARVTAGDGALETGRAGDGPVTRSGPMVRVVRPGPLKRDLFRFEPIYFPSPPETAPPEPVEQKSVDRAVEETIPVAIESPEARARRVRAASDHLRIRSVMFGTSPMAVIEIPEGKRRTTRLVRPGDVILGFLVADIAAGEVTLEMDGERVVLAPDR